MKLKKIFLFVVLSFFGVVFAEKNLLETAETLNSDNVIEIEASFFEKVEAGFNLTITYKNVKSENPFLSLYGGENSALVYGPIYGAETEKNLIYPDKSSGKFIYTLIPRDVSGLRKKILEGAFFGTTGPSPFFESSG